jgi:hypothetical protein
VIFEALGGLANRLRAVFSRFQPGMQVVWNRYWDCADGHFLDVFEPIEGLEFVDSGATERSWAESDADISWRQHYKLLRPLPALRERILGIHDAVGEYDAMHIRRTDHVTHCRHQNLAQTTDEEFLYWARSPFRAETVFLATDNYETRHAMHGALGRRLLWQGHMEPTTIEAKRNTSLADAVVDLFVCVHAREFMGSAHSSFTDLIERVREVTHG